tara:strand:- start:5496 stop:6134 length:639 start_codon:yes stop_codon:yes gene_type:complete
MKQINVYEKLLNVQSALKVPKNQFNKFMNFNYRSCEDILEYAKPICSENGLVLTTDNKVVSEGDLDNRRVFVRSTARVTCVDSEKHVEVSACAEIPKEKKGMDSSQITGSAQSYSRKYALSGLFSLDDLKDSDSDELTQPVKKPEPKVKKQKYTKKIHDSVIPVVAEKGLTRDVMKSLEKYDISDTYMDEINEANSFSGLSTAEKTLLAEVK